MQGVQRSTQLCMSRSQTSHHKCKTGLGKEPMDKAYPSKQHQRRGEGALFVLSDKSKRSQTSITVHNTCTKTHKIETFFSQRKAALRHPAACDSCSMTASAATLSPSHTKVWPLAADVRQEVAQSPSLSQPHCWYCTPVAEAMATKLNILALLTRTLQQKEVYKFSYKHVCNCQCRMPTPRAMRKRKEQQEQQKKKILPFTALSTYCVLCPGWETHSMMLAEQVFCCVQKESRIVQLPLDVCLTFSIMPVQPHLIRYAPKALHYASTAFICHRIRCPQCEVSHVLNYLSVVVTR